jgi:tetratricopeptide (TPR) repeat protein
MPAPTGAEWSKRDFLDDRGIVDPRRLADLGERLEAAGQHEAWAKALSFAAEHAPSSDVGRRSWVEAGRVWLEALGTPRRAEPFFHRVLATQPDHRECIEALHGLCVAAGRWEEAAELGERMATLASGPERARTLVRVAELVDRRLNQTDRALRCLRAAHEADVEDEEVLRAAFELLTREKRWVEARAALDERARRGGPELAVDYRRLGVMLIEHALFHPLAQDCLQQARALGDGEALAHLDQLADFGRQWAERARELVAAGLETRDKTKASELYVAAAELHLSYGQDSLKADELINRAVLLRGFDAVIRYLEWVYLAQDRRQDLLRRFNRLAASVKDAGTKSEIALRMARHMASDPDADPEALADAFRRVLTLDPGHREAVYAVVRILREIQRPHEAAQALENFLAAVSDEYTKLSVHLQLGHLYAEVLGDTPKAQAHFEAVLAFRPNHAGAATALRALYKDNQEQPLLLGVLKVLLEYMPDVDRRVELLDEMERVASEVGDDEAFAVARRRFDVLPADDATRRQFIQRGHTLGRHHAVAAGLEEAALRLGSPDLYRAAAAVYEERLPRPEDAARCYREALSLDPKDPHARRALENLLRQQDDPEGLADVLQSQLDDTEDPDERKLLLSKLGELYQRELGDDERAAQQFERILALDPEHRGALVALDALYDRTENDDARESVLARRERLADSTEAANDIATRRAALLAGRLGRAEDAAEVHIEILSRQPDRPATVQALLGLLAQEVAPARIAATLERVFARQEEFARQVDMISVLIQHEPEAAERRALALRAAHLCDARLNSIGSAFEYLAIALDLDPTDEAVKDHWLETSRRIGAHVRAARLLSKWLGQELPPAARSSLATALGELQEGPLDDPKQATEAFRMAFEADPSSPVAIAALERLLVAQARHDELAELLSARLARADEKEDRIRLAFALGSIRADHLGEPAAAVESFRQVLALEPEHRPTLARLAGALQAEGRWRELVTVLDRWRAVVNQPQEQAELYAWSADALVGAADAEAAWPRYLDALRLEGELPRAWAGLERLMRSEAPPQLRAGAASRLVEHFRAQERWEETVEALQVQLQHEADPAIRRARFEELAELSRHHLDDPGRAFEAQARALAEEGLDPARLPELVRDGLDAHRARDVVQALEQHRARHPEDIAALRLLARVSDGQAADPTGARRAWEAVLELQPGDAEALEALERLTAADDDPRRLAEVLAAKAEAADDPTARVDHWRRAAGLWEESADTLEPAAGWLERAVELRPEDPQLVGELARLYERLGRTEARRDLLARLVGIRSTAAGVADAEVALGHCELELGRPEAAVQAYTRALEKAPDHGPARSGLEALLESEHAGAAARSLEPVYRRIGDWARLVHVYEVLAGGAEDAREGLEWAVAIRALYEDRLGAPKRALAAAERAYILSGGAPEHGEAWLRIGLAAGAHQAILDRLRALAGESLVPEPAARRLIAHATDTWDRPADERMAAWRDWVEVEETSESLDGWIRVVASSGSPHDLVGLLERREGLEGDGQVRAQLAERRAEVLVGLRDPGGAADAFERALAADPSRLHLYPRLEQLYVEAGRFDDAAGLLERWSVDEGTTGSERADLTMRAARLRGERLAQRSEAIALAARVLDAPGAVDLMEGWLDAWNDDRVHAERIASTLERHHEAAGDDARLADVLRARLELADTPGARTQVGLRLTEVYGARLGRPDLAHATALRSLLEQPAAVEAFEAADRWSTEADSEAYADALGRAAEQVELELQARYARRALELLGTSEPDERVSRLLGILHRFDPSDEATADALEAQRKQAGDARGLVALYRDRLERADPDQAAGLWEKIARLAEVDLRDDALALEAYQQRARLPDQSAESRERLAALCERTARWDLLEDTLQAAVDAESDSERRARLWLRLARLRRDHRDDAFGAVDAYGALLSDRPMDPGGMSGLGELMKAGTVEVRRKAAAVLLPYLERAEAWEDVVVAQVLRAEAATDLAERKVGFIKAAAVADERLGRPERSLDFVLQALQAGPDDRPLMERAEVLAELAERESELAAFYADVPEDRWTADTSIRAHRWLASYYEGQGDREQAIAAHQLVLQHQPDDRESLQALERLLQGGDFSALVDVFRRRVSAAATVDEQVALLRQLADLQALRMDDPAGAVMTLQRLLELTPSDEGAFARLDQLLDRTERHSERREVLRRWVDHAGDEQRAAEVRLRWARVEAGQLGDLNAADRLVQTNLEALPSHEPTRGLVQEMWTEAAARDDLNRARGLADVLTDACRAAADWGALVDVLPRAAELQVDPPKRSSKWMQLGAVYEERLHQPELAFTAYARAAAELPSDRSAREALRRSAEAAESSEEYVDVLGQILQSGPDPEVALELERERARIMDEVLDEGEPAIQAYQAVLARRPDDVEALEGLERRFRREDRWAALVEVLERKADAVDDPLLWLEAGTIWGDRLHEPAEAARVLRRVREHPSVTPELRIEASNALVRHLEAGSEQFEILVELEREASPGPARQGLRLRLAQAATNPGVAIDYYRSVLDEEPNHAGAQESLTDLLEAEGRWPELVELLERRLEGGVGGRAETALRRKLAMVRATHLDDVDEAIASWREVLQGDPNDREALQALTELYRKTEQWGPLVQGLRTLIPLYPTAASTKSLRFELARVFAEHLGQPQEAAEVGRRILDIEPHTLDELAGLEGIFRRARAFGEAVRVLQRRAEAVDTSEEKTAAWMEIGRLHENEIGRTAGAIQAYQSVLTVDSRHQEAFDALSRLCEESGDYRRLVDLVARRLDGVTDPDQRRQLHLRVAAIQERWLGSKDLAFSAACAAFMEGEADPEAQQWAERLAAETDNWDLLLDLLEEQVDQVPLARAFELRLRAAELSIDPLDEPERAERHLEMALAMQPGHPEAAKLMAGLLTGQKRWEDLVTHLKDQVDLTPAADERAEIWKVIARITEEELLDLEPAIAAWQRVIDLRPGDEEAAAELERIYRTDGRPQALYDALERRLTNLPAGQEGEAERLAIRMNMARVLEADLGQPEQAVELYQEVLRSHPTHQPALEGLEALLIQAERWSELVSTYEAAVQPASGAARTSLLSRLAGVHEERRRDVPAALACLDRILDAEPDHVPSLRTVERLARAEENWARAAEAGERLVELVEIEERPPFLHRLGRLYSEHLKRPDAAERVLDQSLELDPTATEPMRVLEQLYEERGDWAAVIGMLRRRAEATPPGPEATTLQFRLGQVLLQKGYDREGSKQAFEAALALDDGYVPAIDAMAALAPAGSEEALAWSQRAAERTADPADRADRWVRLAHDALDHHDDVDRAIQALEDALSADPEHLPAREELADLLFSDEQWSRAEVHLARLVERLDPVERRADLGRLQYRLAYIAERDGDNERALRHYLRSYENDSSYLPTLEGLGAALVEAERYEDAQRIFQTILVQHRGELTDAEVVELHQQVGAMAARLGQTDRAAKAFAKALEIDPDHVPSLAGAAELMTQLARYEEAYELRQRLIPLLDDDARFEALLAQGTLCRDQIQEPFRAIDALQQARQLRPDDRRVLEGLVPLYRTTRQTAAAVDALLRLADGSDEEEARITAWLEAGDLLWSEEQDWARAAELYNRVLDAQPKRREALERLEKMLYEARQWGALEESYMRMIQRLPKEEKKPRAALWRTLAELYRQVFRDAERSLKALEVVYRLEPNDLDVGLQLVRSRRQDSSRRAETIQLAQGLLAKLEDPTEMVRMLYELHYEMGHVDRAFCGLGALVLRRVATEDEVRAYRHLVDQAPAWPTGSLTDGQWQTQVLHPWCRGPVGQLAAALHQAAPELFGGRKQEAGIKRKERIDLGGRSRNARANLHYFEVWKRVAMALGSTDVEHAHRPGSVQPPSLLPGRPPVLFVGEQHEVFRTMPVRQLAWLIGRQMACVRPELAPVKALAAGDFIAVMEAAVQVVEGRPSGASHPVEAAVVTAWAKALQGQLTERSRAALAGPVRAAVGQGGLHHLAAYLEGAEHSASRAALLVAGDWVVAARGLGDGAPLFELPYARRVQQLSLFSVSEELRSLREALHLSVQV